MTVASEIPLLLQDHLAGRYVLKREVGRGGAATVYLAHDLKHERLVAIKVLHPELSHALGAQRFMREIKLTASLQHPHILPIHDSGQAEEQLFYVMPFVEGDSMRERLTADSRLSIEEAVRIGREIAGALAYAHERGVVHRDIKPENILFSGGHAVLADFGIARAINRASEKITQQGMITGTPAYMSPEQARDRAFDGRSDVYSLACVLYEAIAGVPPFVGDTPQQLLSQRITRTPPLLREYRHDVPAPIEAVIAKALATSPDDRYDDARSFSAALSAAIGNSGESLGVNASRRWTRNPWLYAAGILLMITGGTATSPSARERIDIVIGRVDSAQYAVLPFQYIGAPAPEAATEPVSNGVYDAMRSWEGLRVAGELSVSDAMRGHAGELSVNDVASIARRTRAGRAVWGRVRFSGDSVVVRVGLYNALSGQSLREVREVVHARGPAALQKLDFRQMVADLLIPPRPALLASRGDRGTKSFGAWQHYQSGAAALEDWNLPRAASELDSALALDPAFPQANLWLAQVKLWRGEGSKEWVPSYLAADRARAQLSPRELLLLDGIGATSRSDYPAACRDYDRLRQRDSLDVAAWLGLALCHGNDHAVVASRGSRTGFAFRSSPEEAWRAASRALEIAPASFAVMPFAWLKSILLVDEYKIRTGTLGTITYSATPVRVGDSVTYPLLPKVEMAAGRSPHIPGEPALRFNRDRMLAVIEMLARRLPENPDVFEALATLLETRQEITGTPSGRYSALTALERARTLATEPSEGLRLAIADVRLHLKLGDFARAAAGTDSILHAPRDSVSANDASLLAGLAAFSGDAGATTRYLLLTHEVDDVLQGVSLPGANQALAALLARSALGLCGDSLNTLVQAVDRSLATNVAADARAQLHDRLIERQMLLAAPCSEGRSALLVGASPIKILAAQKAVARGDLRAVTAYFDSVAVYRRGWSPTRLSPDFVVQESWLMEKVGDPRGAGKRLDVMLSSLLSLHTEVLSETGMSAAIGRAMAYRAELAARTDDPITATLWANRVLTLWAHAAPNMKPTLARMRQLAAARPTR